MRNTAVVVASLALVAGLSPLGAAGGAHAEAAGARHLPGTSCQVFPADNYWHADVSRLPVNRRSKAWLAHMSPDRMLHPDFGPSYGAQSVPYGIPYTVVGHGHRRVHVSFDYASESDHVRYPVGSDSKVEGGAGAGGDRHVLIVDKGTCRLYELFNARHTSRGWHAGSGAT